MAISRTSSLPRASDASVTEPPAATGPGPRTIHPIVKLALWSVLFWTALSLLFASQIYALRDGQVSWAQALAWVMPRWYVWGLLTPAIFWMDRRIGVGRTFAARVAWHVPLGFAWICLSIFIRLLIDSLRTSTEPLDLRRFFLERFYWDLLVYGVIAGVSMARERQAEAHRLALQTADLERRLVESQLQSLRTQVQPHFLFNALNTISAFTETDPPTARDLMQKLGDLLRAALTHASRPFVTLGEELTFLDDYLQIESARFEGRISVAVQADDDLLDLLVPSFLLQPLVENAIRIAARCAWRVRGDLARSHGSSCWPSFSRPAAGTTRAITVNLTVPSIVRRSRCQMASRFRSTSLAGASLHRLTDAQQVPLQWVMPCANVAVDTSCDSAIISA